MLLEKKSALLAGVCALTLGCVENVDDPVDTMDVDPEDRVAEIIDNLVAAGYDESQIEVVEDVVTSNGTELVTTGPRVMVEGDIHVTLEASRELLGEPGEGELVEGEPSFRHWRTPTLVTNNSTICLIRSTELLPQIGPAVFLPITNEMAEGVLFASDNYNALNLGLSFEIRDAPIDINGNAQLTPAQAQGCDFQILFGAFPWGSLGGQSGFPSGGAPYDLVIMTGTGNNQWFEHIATHEIGHAIGLRHSDWMNRESCGQNVGEAPMGTVGIPGTPVHTIFSIMAACLPGATNGEFWYYDVVALDFMY